MPLLSKDYLESFCNALVRLSSSCEDDHLSTWGKNLGETIRLSEFETGSKIPRHVIIHGKVSIGNNCSFIGPAVICGPSKIGSNVIFGPFSYVRPGSIICDYAEVGHCVEIKNSFIGQGVRLRHKCYIGDSYIGSDVNLGSCNCTSVKKLKGTPRLWLSTGKAVEFDFEKIGTIIGEGTESGVGVKFMPGTYIGANSQIYPCLILKGYHPPHSVIQTSDIIG